MPIQTSDEGTSYCTQCEAYARENERLRDALKKIAESLTYEEWARVDGDMSGEYRSIAKSALERDRK